MTDASLADRYGLPDQFDVQKPEQVLLVLGYGRFFDRRCSPEGSCPFAILASSADASGVCSRCSPPFERLLVPLSGSGMLLDIRLHWQFEGVRVQWLDEFAGHVLALAWFVVASLWRRGTVGCVCLIPTRLML